MTKLKLSIIIPIFNERESLNECYRQLKEIFQKRLSNYEKEIIFINDGSTDNSLVLLRQLQKLDRQVKIVSFRRNLGKSAALQEGFKRASGAIIVTLDGDLQDDPSNIPQLIKKLSEGVDLVVGWRKNRQDSFSKKIISKIFNLSVRFISRVLINDFNTGLKVMTKEVADELHLYGELYRFMPLLAVQRGFKVSEVPVPHRSRVSGKSKYGWKRLVSGFFDFLTVLFLGSFNNRPLHFFGLVGGLEIVLGTIFGIYLSILRFQGETIGRRPLLTLALLLIITGMQLVSIGLIAEMIVSRSRQDEKLPIDFKT